jgi:ribonuclease VapC
MVLDTSAVLAILFKEPERDRFATAIAEAGVRLISSVNALEAAVVLLARKGPAGLRELDLLFHFAHVAIVPFSDTHLLLARDGYQRYGKGRSPAGLNLGDCCAYALSRHSGEPLLFKGGDFSLTDVVPAL